MNESRVPPRQASIAFDRSVDVDALLDRVVQRLDGLGFNLAGIVQIQGPPTADARRNVRLRGLRGGWEIPILEARGRQARGCRLDSSAIAEVSALLEADLEERPDLLIVNRFGRAESEGQGLRQILLRAAMDGIPLLVAVREDYAADWARFHGGMATSLPAELGPVLDWCRAACGQPGEDAPASCRNA